ncbi:hemin uptake protein HemP [Roseinatronobacter bogoriensis]|uniref:Hemin uptake protein HemP n=1 Tax=Roseinatronobacter bogoriensis subsp. barguzinensis TaxID=441209 RepID=A0A2K8K8A3_9RHOB|nr:MULTISPECIES: hemin uptake protein HemP [Rhodobaca]ATX65674.1 hemin uptake protein HemP [Rhodobaca barguzinensis]
MQDEDKQPGGISTVPIGNGRCAEAVPTHCARSLTGGGQTAHICLMGQTYVLRITRAGKLILTK